MLTEIRERMLTLGSVLTWYDEEYYVNDNSVISDSQYDELKRELVELEAEHPNLRHANSPTSRVGHGKSTFEDTEHKSKMYSLNNALNEDELKKFLSSFNEDSWFVIEPKLDGLSMNVFYEESQLKTAATRGDGNIGEDITANARTIANLPLRTRDTNVTALEVRGEVVMSNAMLNKLNESATVMGSKQYSNPRNAASGSLRAGDPRVTASRGLQFIAYDIGFNQGFHSSTHTDTIAALNSLGFETGLKARLVKHGDVISIVNKMAKQRASWPYEIDGLVIKLDDLGKRKELGYTSTAPNWAIAFKFPPEVVTTTVEDITTQVGRTGAITPVAKITPVKCGGVMVSSVTLHNFEEVARLDIRVGDSIDICRSGDVIPKVVKVHWEKRAHNNALMLAPTNCPECNSIVIKDDNVVVKCSDVTCPARVVERLTMFASRKAMDWDGIGPGVVGALVSNDLIKYPMDFLTLSSKVSEMESAIGKAITAKILKEIHSTKEYSLAKVIYALGIDNVGESTAHTLAMNMTPENLMDSTKAELIALPDIGDVVSASIVTYFEVPFNRTEFMAILKAINLKPITLPTKDRLGEQWVITGSFDGYSRDELKAILMSKGAKVSGTVSKKTTAVLVGRNAGDKQTKAEKLGIRIAYINEIL
jgi:DNA ligase (NAD+)